MISTHILDTSQGQPAAQVEVRLEKLDQNKRWMKIDQQQTNTDGRIQFNCHYEIGDYRLVFEIEEYFSNSFFLDAVISFRIVDLNRKYHIPLLLNPFGYTTYRGS